MPDRHRRCLSRNGETSLTNKKINMECTLESGEFPPSPPPPPYLLPLDGTNDFSLAILGLVLSGSPRDGVANQGMVRHGGWKLDSCHHFSGIMANSFRGLMQGHALFFANERSRLEKQFSVTELIPEASFSKT